MGAVPIMTAATLLGALALGQLFVKIHQSDRASREITERATHMQRHGAAPSEAERKAKRVRLERTNAREARVRKRCQRLLRTEYNRMRKRQRHRPATNRDTRRLVSNLPARCRRMMARR